VSDEHQNKPPHEREATIWIVVGVVLVVAGFLLSARNLGIMPWGFDRAWEVVREARYGIGVLALGVLLIVWAQSGRRLPTPAHGAKLYRTRHDKWIAGVLGGLAHYFNVDATILRLVFLALLFLGAEVLIGIYIVMAIVVPLEPVGGVAASQAPVQQAAWPTTGAPAPTAPAAPAPPAAPTAPAPPAPTEAPANAAAPAPPVEAPAAPEGWDDGTPPPPAPPL
jgi:phage shock protein C